MQRFLPGERKKVLFIRTGSFAQRLSVLFDPNSVGAPIMLTGSDRFKDKAIKIIVEKRMDVRLGDPALEAKRTALEAARDLVKSWQEHNQEITRDVQEPSKEQPRGGWEL
jgi:hypothetical protein